VHISQIQQFNLSIDIKIYSCRIWEGKGGAGDDRIKITYKGDKSILFAGKNFTIVSTK
jgi:hypothetical protein